MYVTFLLLCTNLFLLTNLCQGIEFVSRAKWGAVAPTNIKKLTALPNYVFVHHSYITKACFNLTQCTTAMQDVQGIHMVDHGLDDIGYSFGIGSDGRVYEAQGWDRVGDHTLGYNSVGLGFLVIGSYDHLIPNPKAIATLKGLIKYAVAKEKISPNYILRGHRDMVTTTECPGQALYDLIRTWPHY